MAVNKNEFESASLPMQAPAYRRWFIRLLTAGIVCEIFFLYEDTLLWMKTAWLEYAPDRAGALVPPLFLWMAYNRLNSPLKTTGETPCSGYLLICFSLAVLAVGKIADINFLQALSMLGVGFGLVIILGGLRLGAMFLFPFAFLVLMIPSVSYLLESIAGALLRQAVLHGSAVVLKIMDGAWEMTPAGMGYNGRYLQIQFFRGGISSVLSLLILNFVVAEGAVKRESWKFLFTALFGIIFVFAFSIYFILSGWAISANRPPVHAFMAVNALWIPAFLFLFLLVSVRIFVRGAAKKRLLTNKG